MTRRGRGAGDGQLAFDLETLIAQVRSESAPWDGAPLGFTTGYQRPADLDAAFEQWKLLNGVMGSSRLSRMWCRAAAVPAGVAVGEHGFDMFTADLRCEPWGRAERHVGCSCVGGLTYQVVCEPCGWHVITGRENGAVEAWHDHAFPGWRELPVVPARLRDRGNPGGLSKAALRWIAEHYPPSAQVTGAPVITERDAHGTRHVPGRSPWRGYDISHTALDPLDHDTPAGRRNPPLPPARRAVSASGRSIGD